MGVGMMRRAHRLAEKRKVQPATEVAYDLRQALEALPAAVRRKFEGALEAEFLKATSALREEIEELRANIAQLVRDSAPVVAPADPPPAEPSPSETEPLPLPPPPPSETPSEAKSEHRRRGK